MRRSALRLALALALGSLLVDGLALPLHSWLDHGHGSEERKALPGESDDPGAPDGDLEADCWVCARASSARRPALVTHDHTFVAPPSGFLPPGATADDAPPQAVVFAPAHPRAPPTSA